MIAKPFSPGNASPAEGVEKERIMFDKALIGSCTNGGYDDKLSAALVLRAARTNGLTKTAKEFVILPGSGGVKEQIERPDARLGGEGYLGGPSVVAASAMLGYMAPPSELGLAWQAEAFAV